MGSITYDLRPLDEHAAVAGYVRKPGDAAYAPPAIDVLRVQDEVFAEIVPFGGAVFEHFDLPVTLTAAVGVR